MQVLQFPLVRMTVFFIAGILFAHWAKPQIQVLSISVFTLLILLLIVFSRLRKSKRDAVFFGVLILSTSFCTGALVLLSAMQTNNPAHYIHRINSEKQSSEMQLEVTEKRKTTAYFERYVANLLLLDGRKSYGRVLINIKKTGKPVNIEIGSHLQLTGRLTPSKPPKNPNQFDYGKYLENQQVFGQCYATYQDIKISDRYSGSLSHYAGKWRNKIIRKLEQNHFGKTELAVLSALILGQQQDIPESVIRDYQYAGAVHILSVSGLHVGLILLFVNFLLKPVPNTRKSSFVKLLIVLASLWGFGILAGLAPSVVRSVTMFSFVAVGLFLRRSVNIYHTLFVSALLILFVQPSFLFDVGFQLSYLALFFIIWLQPLLSGLWEPKNKIATYFWELLTVSFAAQIGTLPLSIYYFHQFPGLFFVTNLIVLPMLGLIMALGVVVMLLAVFDFVWLPLLKFLEWGIWLLDHIIGWVASFESLILKDIPLNAPVMLLGYLCICSFIIWMGKRNFRTTFMALTSVVLLQSAFLWLVHDAEKKQEFIVFNQKKKTLITQRSGLEVAVYSDVKSDNDFALKPYLIGNMGRVVLTGVPKAMYYFKGDKILLIDSSACYKGIEKPDVLLLTQSPKVNLERLFLDGKPRQVVADGSNFKTYVKRWEQTCAKEKIPFHYTVEKGFYKLD